MEHDKASRRDWCNRYNQTALTVAAEEVAVHVDTAIAVSIKVKDVHLMKG